MEGVLPEHLRALFPPSCNYIHNEYLKENEEASKSSYQFYQGSRIKDSFSSLLHCFPLDLTTELKVI